MFANLYEQARRSHEVKLVCGYRRARELVPAEADAVDLRDGGAGHFADCISAVRELSPDTRIEILVPDFRGRLAAALDILAQTPPDVMNHNLETVPRLYPTIRPGARYFTSLRLLSRVKEIDPKMFTKSGLMVGLGETREEILQVMDDLRAADVDFLTVGQYLQPTPKHAPIDRFWTPAEFEELSAMARAKGFLMVSASPLTRSSYLAGDDFARLKAARQK